MRKVIVSINVSLDGFMSGPHGELDWHFPYWTDAMTNYAIEQLGFADTILLGRKTYEAMAEHWPTAQSDVFSDLMNKHAKLVFSTTMRRSCWQPVRVFRSDPIGTVKAMKAMPGKSIIIYGSKSIVNALTSARLVDEYRVWIHPIVLGEGVPLFEKPTAKLNLTLLRTHVFNSGVVLQVYGLDADEN